MKTSPAFQWYPSDYLASMRVQMMTLEQEGIYRRLLDYCWLNGSIPCDLTLLKRLIGKECSNGALEMVVTMFQPDGDKLVHDRLDAERRKQANWREKSADGGRKSARKRWGKSPDAQRSEKGSFQNGSNQNVTLQSSVFSLQSSSDPNPAKPKEAKKRQTNERLETLVRCQCGKIEGVTRSVWSFAQKILLELNEATPGVTADEIARRWENMKLRFPGDSSLAALAKWWVQCEEAPTAVNGKPAHVCPEPDNLRFA